MRRPSKYGNRKTVIDGITFASAAEAKRYGELRLLEKAGEISHLTVQPRYPLTVNGVKVCTYVADFSYVDEGSVAVIVEDVKGVRTDVFKLKAKLMRAVHGIDVVEISKSARRSHPKLAQSAQPSRAKLSTPKEGSSR